MADFADQIRSHYDGKSLSAEKAESILASGRAVAGQGDDLRGVQDAEIIRPSAFRRWLPRVAAVAAVILGIAYIGNVWRSRDAQGAPFSELPVAVIAFFAHEPPLAKAPQDKAELRKVLIAKGAPEELQIPAKLLPLETAACSIVGVHGRPAWLACFWRDQRADRGDHDLVHLLVARKSDFRDEPDGARAEWKEMNGWTFASWSEGSLVYTVATSAPPEKLRPFVGLPRALPLPLAVID